MRIDPLVEEIHEVRRRLWEASGRSLETYCTHLKKIEEQFKDRLIKPEEWRSSEARSQAALPDQQ